jgi:hypothetical protein
MILSPERSRESRPDDGACQADLPLGGPRTPEYLVNARQVIRGLPLNFYRQRWARRLRTLELILSDALQVSRLPSHCT